MILTGPNSDSAPTIDALMSQRRGFLQLVRVWPGQLMAFRLNPGEIHLMRNAGGIISDDVVRSLAISQHALGTREVMIVHHTDCGLAKLKEDEFREELAKFAGYRPTWSVQAFKDPHDSVRESMRRVKDSRFLHHTGDVRGFIFDVETGLLEEVLAEDEPIGQGPAAENGTDAG